MIALLTGGLVAAAAGGRLFLAHRALAGRSQGFLGKTRAQERTLSAAVGVDLERFLVLAQRILWGILQPDLIRVDVAAVCHQLVREYPDFFVTHLMVAFAARSARRDDEAETALAQARQLQPVGHPLSYLMPSSGDWECQPPALAIEEIVPGTIWRVPCYYTHGFTPFLEFMYATLVRLDSGGLVLINPVALTPELLTAIRALGEVTHIVAPVKFHNLYIADTQRHFPAAKCYGVAGHRVNPPSAKLRFDGFLDDNQPLFGGQLEQVAVSGHQFEETAFFHPASRTAIFHDLVIANQTQVPGSTFWFRLYAFVWGVHDEVAIASYHPMMWTNIVALRRSLRKLLQWDAERVLLCHAPAAAIPAHGQEIIRKLFGWVTDLSVSEYLILVSSFFRRQPGFLRDFTQYLIKQRQ